MGCSKEQSLSHTSVFGVGGATGPALNTFASLIPSDFGSVSPPAGLDTLTYETAFFKILVDAQEYADATVKVGDVQLSYDADKKMYMAVDSTGAPLNISLDGGTQISINVPKYNENVIFTLPSVSPPDSIFLDTIVHNVGDSIRVSWSQVSGVDSVQVFFKLADKNPHLKNLPPTDTVFYIPSTWVDTTGVALIMVNVLKLINISDALPPSRMILLKGKALPGVQVQ